MRAQTVEVKESAGRILCNTIFRPGGRKLLAKGHVISEEDIRLLDRLPQDRRIASLRCLAASAQLFAVEDAKETDRRQILIDHGFIVDAQHTLPPDAAVASLLIGKSISGDLLTKADAKRWFFVRFDVF